MDLEAFLPLVGGLRGTEPDAIKGGPQFCGRRNETDTVMVLGVASVVQKGAPPARFGEDPWDCGS